MRNKCKVCGYRFHDKNELICPECFTSRQEEMECRDFSDDLHSHNRGISDSFSRNDYTTPNTDSFKEDNSFIEQERRSESKNENFRSDENVHTQNNFTQSFSYNAGNNTENFRNNNRQTNFVPNRSFDPNIPVQTNYSNSSCTKGKKTSGGCTLAIIIAVIIFISAGNFLVPLLNYVSDILGSSKNYSESTDEGPNDNYDYIDVEENAVGSVKLMANRMTTIISSKCIMTDKIIDSITNYDPSVEYDTIELSLEMKSLDEKTTFKVHNISADAYADGETEELNSCPDLGFSGSTYDSYYSITAQFVYDNSANYLNVDIELSYDGNDNETEVVIMQINLNEIKKNNLNEDK